MWKIGNNNCASAFNGIDRKFKTLKEVKLFVEYAFNLACLASPADVYHHKYHTHINVGDGVCWVEYKKV